MMTIEELEKYIGLKKWYIRKVIRELKEELKSYIKHGQKNSLLFNSDAIAIFDRIKHLKEQGYNIKTIQRELNTENQEAPKIFKDKQNKNTTQAKHTQAVEKDSLTHLLLMVEKKDEEVNGKRAELEEAKKQILELEFQNKSIQSKVKLLTDGKTDEEILKERRAKQDIKLRIVEILTEIEGMEGKMFIKKRRKELIAELKELNRKA